VNAPTVLQEWSAARSSLSVALAPRAVSLASGRHRTLSGFYWRADLIVTAAEALGGDEDVRVVAADGEHLARVLACDLTTDIAVLRVSAGLAWSSRRGGTIDQRLELDGSLVADFAGSPQAMLVGGPRGTLLGVPVSTIERIVACVEQHGYLPRPYLGLRLQHLRLDETTCTRWGRTWRTVAAVASVEEGSPAEKAGLAPGDLIEALDGAAVENIEALAARLAGKTPGQTLELLRRRGGQSQTLTIELGERRASNP
jgi:S1-C subfamily serine protease